MDVKNFTKRRETMGSDGKKDKETVRVKEKKKEIERVKDKKCSLCLYFSLFPSVQRLSSFPFTTVKR